VVRADVQRRKERLRVNETVHREPEIDGIRRLSEHQQNRSPGLAEASRVWDEPAQQVGDVGEKGLGAAAAGRVRRPCELGFGGLAGKGSVGEDCVAV